MSEYKMSPDDIKHAMEQRAGVLPEQLTSALLREAKCLERVCVLPEPANERASYLAHVLVQMLTTIPKDDELRATVGTICQALSYMTNSASWREGELFDFDREELRRKLERFSR